VIKNKAQTNWGYFFRIILVILVIIEGNCYSYVNGKKIEVKLYSNKYNAGKIKGLAKSANINHSREQLLKRLFATSV